MVVPKQQASMAAGHTMIRMEDNREYSSHAGRTCSDNSSSLVFGSCVVLIPSTSQNLQRITLQPIESIRRRRLWLGPVALSNRSEMVPDSVRRFFFGFYVDSF